MLDLSENHISENRIGHIREVERLLDFPYLADLFLAPNPVDELPYYRTQVLYRLPKLRWLDEAPATAEEKVKASLTYGEDVVKRQEIFDKLLPEEAFVDRRVVTKEAILDMELEKFGNEGGFFTEGSVDDAGIPNATNLGDGDDSRYVDPSASMSMDTEF